MLKKKYGYWQIAGPERGLLKECVAQEKSGQYDIRLIYCSDGYLSATDGRRLVVVESKQNIKNGAYKMTEEGWFLGPIYNTKWPDYQKLIPTKETAKTIAAIRDFNEISIEAFIVGELYKAGVVIGTALLFPVLKEIKAMSLYMVQIWVMKEDTSNRYFMLTGDGFTYLQMPIDIS